MKKTISIRLNEYDLEILESYKKLLSICFKGMEISNSQAIKRALYMSNYYDPLIETNNKKTE